MAEHKIYSFAFGDIYDAYVAKAERKERTEPGVRELIQWMTGYDNAGLDAVRADGTTMREFFEQAPALHPARELVTGSICGVKIQELEDPLMKLIRQLDKVIDELAKGKAMEKIKRSNAERPHG
ncbi:DUF2200 domain-containing protein [Corynebacterium phoceense]|uniref:DUF2200 domain-containing protein n=1 Tax=Corynebacterium phoceense TaxID=1686286 RepID=UPI00211C41E7|nr:DUF2200 domain-containing protein [Corynebacterium phoceense]MCQ9337204.1 DUF2200 domain-containing protein [Corynebacterium phoceense]